MFRIKVQNSVEKPCYLQIDPWATVYRLKQGESIEIEAECDVESPAFEMDECGETKILTLLHCDEYFICHGGKRLHWTEYQSNFSEQPRT